MRTVKTFGIFGLVLGVGVGLAGPAWGAETWDMPEVKNMTLAQARAAIVSLPYDTEFAITTFNTTGTPQPQYNETNWIVCYQYPSAEDSQKLSSKTKVTLGVRRPNQTCWG